MLAWLAAAAWGQADIRIEAQVSDDLRTIQGTLRMRGDLEAWVVDPLALLPDPVNDLHGLRTFPGAADHGRVDFEKAADGLWTFESTLPRRFGDVGSTRHGLMANGQWYPQPITVDGVPVLDWDIHVRLPDGATGALGDTVGNGMVSWTGTGERASLAVVRRGRLTWLDGTDVVWLTRGRPGKRVQRELETNLALVPIDLEGVVVEAPLRRRLVRSGPGLSYLSNRAFRLTPGLEFVHRRAVVRGLLAGWLPIADPFERELAAAGIGQIHAERLAGVQADRLLGLFRWVPQINSLLASRRIAYYSEVLDRTHPGDPVHDDLLEVLDPHTPGTAVVAQLDHRYGPGTGQRIAADLWMDEPLARAATRQEVDGAWLESWRGPYPRQDYRMSVDKGEQTVTLVRDAPDDAQREVVVLRVDGEDRDLLLAPGSVEIDLGAPPRRLLFDPGLDTAQTSRTGESWPPRYDVTLAGYIDTINVSQQQLFLGGFMTLRRRYDTRNLFLGRLSNSRQDLVAADLGYLRRLGGLQDGISRPHRLRWNLGTALLNPAFAETDGLQVTLDGFVSYSWDTRVSSDFPLRGRRLGISVGGGGIPGTQERFANVSGSGVGVASFHPRHAIAARATAALARSTVPHRLLTLGGGGAMRSIPTLPACPATDPDTGEPLPCTVLATERIVGMIEYRWAPLRNLSVPMGILWGSELQLAGGAEGIVARVDGEIVEAAGATAGVYALGDMLGAETSGAGVTLAWPLWWDGIDELEPTAIPEVYLKFYQAF